MAAAIITALAPLAEQIVLHFRHADGTTSTITVESDAKKQNDLNAQQIQAFVDSLKKA